MPIADQYKLSAISHVMLGVSNLAASVEFYCSKLGLELTFQTQGFAFLNGGGVALCLSEPLANFGGPVVGATEVVFSVTGVEQAHAALSARGVEFIHGPRQVSAEQWAANFTDPDGHRLSVFGPKS